MRPVIAAFLAVFLMPAEHAVASHCYTAAEMSEAVLNTVSRLPISVEHDLGGDRARRFIAAYNEIPPPTEYAGDRVMIYGQPGSLKVLVTIYHDDCISFRSFIQRDVVERIIPNRTEAL